MLFPSTKTHNSNVTNNELSYDMEENEEEYESESDDEDEYEEHKSNATTKSPGILSFFQDDLRIAFKVSNVTNNELSCDVEEKEEEYKSESDDEDEYEECKSNATTKSPGILSFFKMILEQHSKLTMKITCYQLEVVLVLGMM